MIELILLDELDAEIERRSAEAGESLADTLMAAWPDGFPNQTVFVADGDGNLLDADTTVARVTEDGDVYQIALRPQALEFLALQIIPGLLTVGQVVLTGATLLLNFLLKPSMPKIGQQYEWDSSDQPQFMSGQSNQFRPGSRVPEVLGLMRVWPDLLAEPAAEYLGDSQTLDEIYCVSNGTCDISDVRLYDEDVTDMPSSSFTVYVPGDPWPLDYPIMRSNAFVGSVELPGPNESTSSAATVTINTTGTFFVDVDDYFSGIPVGSHFTIDYTDLDLEPAGTTNAQFYTVTFVSTNGKSLGVSPAPVVQKDISDGSMRFYLVDDFLDDGAGGLLQLTGWEDKDREGDYRGTVHYIEPNPGLTGSAVTLNFLTRKGATWESRWYDGVSPTLNKGFWPTSSSDRAADMPSPFYYIKYSDDGNWNPDVPGTGFSTSVFSVPGTVTEIHFDIEFPGGLYRQVAGGVPATRAVEIAFYWRWKGTTGTWNQELYTYSDLTRTARRFTTKFTPPNAPGEYECYFERITDWTADTNDTVTVDACRVIGLRGRQQVLGTALETDILDCTLVRLNLSTQNLAQVSQSRSLNVIAQRLLPDWAEGDGTTLVRTRLMRDAILYTLLGSPDNPTVWSKDDVDVAGLEQISATLWNIAPDASRFNGIIDQTITPEDQMMLIANNYHIMVHRRATYVGFTRLEAGIIPRTLINARNKIAPESKTMNFSLQNEPDAIIMRYMDEDDDYRENTIQYPDNVTPINPSEQAVLGITKGSEIQRIAEFLWAMRKYERDVAEVQVTDEGTLWSPGDVVAMTDALSVEQPYEGEVIQIDGDTQVLDQPLPDGDYIATLRGSDGELISRGAHTSTGGEDGTVSVTAWIGATMPTSEKSQVGLLYSFTPVTDAGAELYYVTSIKPSQDGPVTISLVRYDDRTYASDSMAPVAVPAMKRSSRRGD